MKNKRNILHKTISMIHPLIPFCSAIDMDSARKYSRTLAYKASEYRPDIVIGIAIGGLYPAYEVSLYLDCEMDTIQISHYRYQMSILKDMPGVFRIVKITRDLISRNQKPLLIKNTKSKNFEGKKLLVVDDNSLNGETLEFTKEYLERRNSGDVKTAVLLKHGKYKPDFFAVECFKGAVLPWREISPYYDDYLERTANLGLI